MVFSQKKAAFEQAQRDLEEMKSNLAKDSTDLEDKKPGF